MLIKCYVVLHKWFKVISMVSHVFNCFSSVTGVTCMVSINLISQRTKQAISISKHVLTLAEVYIT